MKIKWLIANVTAAGSPARAKRDILEVMLDVFWPIQATFVIGEPFCDLQIPSCALITLLMTFNENRVLDCQ